MAAPLATGRVGAEDVDKLSAGRDTTHKTSATPIACPQKGKMVRAVTWAMKPEVSYRFHVFSLSSNPTNRCMKSGCIVTCIANSLSTST